MSAPRSHDPRASSHSVLGGLPSTRDDAWRERLLEALLSSYQSLEEPKYWFVRRRHKSPPEALLKEVGVGSSVRDLTDINDDVRWNFELARGDAHLDLVISMVGPYAVVLRHGPVGHRTPVTSAVECQPSLERDVLARMLREERGTCARILASNGC